MGKASSSPRIKTYSHFDLNEVETAFGLQERSIPLFEQVAAISPSEWLQKTLALGSDPSVKSEKARSERLVTPILLEIKSLNNGHLTIYSGERLDVSKEEGLSGECDFIISAAPPSVSIQAPIITLVEAKKNDVAYGLGQCVAQMIGAQKFNQLKKNNIHAIYGCVSTGTIWQFIRLEGTDLAIDTRQYFISDLGEILGVFQHIIDSR